MPHLKHGLRNHPTRYLIVKDLVDVGRPARVRWRSYPPVLTVSTSFFKLASCRRCGANRVPVSRSRRSVSTHLRAARQHFFSRTFRSAVALRTALRLSAAGRAIYPTPRCPSTLFFKLRPFGLRPPDTVAAFRSGRSLLAVPARPVNSFFHSPPGDRCRQAFPPRFPAAGRSFYVGRRRSSSVFCIPLLRPGCHLSDIRDVYHYARRGGLSIAVRRFPLSAHPRATPSWPATCTTVHDRQGLPGPVWRRSNSPGASDTTSRAGLNQHACKHDPLGNFCREAGKEGITWVRFGPVFPVCCPTHRLLP